MTEKLDLDALKALIADASEGPWEDLDLIVENSDRFICHCATYPDAEFIAAARTALPGLVEEVERLRKVLAWYGENARLCHRIDSEGDKSRNALSDDGGKRAKAALKGDQA